MQQSIDAFLAAPSEAGFASAKQSWLAAREPYLQTEAYRFYGGPIDDANGPEPRINSWPLDEAYVDYVEGAPHAGIINDTVRYPTLDRDLLVSLNESGAEENISVGYHAIEFLLWGQDLSADGPGARPYTDYVAGVGPNAARRATYLGIVTDLLVDDLGEVAAAWDPDDPADYRAEFLSLEPDQALRDILVGIGVLSKSELAGERLFTAYDNQDQEDEHSCFSDNTNRDVVLNAQGIENVYTGRYERIDGSVIEGPGLDDLLGVVDPESGEELTELIQASVAAVKAIPAPFDRAIVEPDSRPLVLDAVYALQDQGDKIAEVATRLGLTITTALPE
jgi:putative iron-regulated protein